MTMQHIGTREEWRAARLELLELEKEHTRRGDELARQRRALPWVPVETDYVFDTEQGPRTLAELFDGRSQLVVQHFMFGPDWTEGCTSCSFWADCANGTVPHLNARDVTFTLVSRGPLDALLPYRERMGWELPWASSAPSSFNRDFGVSLPAGADPADAEYNYGPWWEGSEELPGLSAFVLHDGVVHHTYSTYTRGIDAMNGAYALLDRAPFGRDEGDRERPMWWLRRHDAYDAAVA